jgi:hypothetical protein
MELPEFGSTLLFVLAGLAGVELFGTFGSGLLGFAFVGLNGVGLSGIFLTTLSSLVFVVCSVHPDKTTASIRRADPIIRDIRNILCSLTINHVQLWYAL